MPETERELRILQIRQLVERGEYPIDPARIAASLVEEHLAAGVASPDSPPQDPTEPHAAASAATK